MNGGGLKAANVTCLHTFQEHTVGLNCATWHPRRPDVFATTSDDLSTRVWRLPDDEASSKPNSSGFLSVTRLWGHRHFVSWATFISYHHLATGSEDGTIRVWNIDEGTLLETYRQETLLKRDLHHCRYWCVRSAYSSKALPVSATGEENEAAATTTALFGGHDHGLTSLRVSSAQASLPLAPERDRDSMAALDNRDNPNLDGRAMKYFISFFVLTSLTTIYVWIPMMFATHAYPVAFALLSTIAIVATCGVSMRWFSSPVRRRLGNTISFNSHSGISHIGPNPDTAHRMLWTCGGILAVQALYAAMLGLFGDHLLQNHRQRFTEVPRVDRTLFRRRLDLSSEVDPPCCTDRTRPGVPLSDP